MKYVKAKQTNYYDIENYEALLNRLDHIKADAERKWGAMTATQMLHHLSLAIGSGLGYFTLPDDSNFIRRTVTRFMVLDVLKRFPISAETAKPLKVGADNLDFDTEKKLLKEILAKAYQTKTDADWGGHTYFGKMTRQAWGKLIIIHCNHHFQQFGY